MSGKESNKSKLVHGRGGARPGSGRPKGALDKGNAMIREMIVDALDAVGGVQYLQTTAKSHPAAFLSLIGKVMPVQVSGPDGGPIEHAHAVSDATRGLLAGLSGIGADSQPAAALPH